MNVILKWVNNLLKETLSVYNPHTWLIQFLVIIMCMKPIWNGGSDYFEMSPPWLVWKFTKRFLQVNLEADWNYWCILYFLFIIKFGKKPINLQAVVNCGTIWTCWVVGKILFWIAPSSSFILFVFVFFYWTFDLRNHKISVRFQVSCR